jgi:hypothetical protein
MNRLARLWATLLVSSVMLLVPPAMAQNQGAQREVDEGRAMIRAGFRDVIRDELLLTEQETVAFWPVYDEYERTVAAIMDRYASLIMRYVDRFESGDLSNEYADELLSEYFTIRQELLDTRRAYIPKFKEVLPPLKVAQLYQLENKLNAEVDIQLALTLPLISE